MLVRFHGLLAERYGDSFIMQTETVADAMEGLSRQLNMTGDLLVDVVGFDTEEKLRQPTDVEAIDVIPSLHGGGGNFGKIIAGAVLIGLSFIPGIGQAVQVALLTSGLTLVAGGVMGFFMKAPTTSKENDPPASKYLGLDKNTTAIGTPIQLAWGRVRLLGHYLSMQSDANQMVRGYWPETPT